MAPGDEICDTKRRVNQKSSDGSMEDSSSNELMNENQTVALHGEVCGVA